MTNLSHQRDPLEIHQLRSNANIRETPPKEITRFSQFIKNNNNYNTPEKRQVQHHWKDSDDFLMCSLPLQIRNDYIARHVKYILHHNAELKKINNSPPFKACYAILLLLLQCIMTISCLICMYMQEILQFWQLFFNFIFDIKCFNWYRLGRSQKVICCFCVEEFATKQELYQHSKDQHTCLAHRSDICDVLQNNYHHKRIIKIRQVINDNNRSFEKYITSQTAKHGDIHNDNIPITPLPIYTAQQQRNIINKYITNDNNNLAPKKLSFDSMDDENDSLDLHNDNNMNLQLYQNAEQYFIFLQKLYI